MNVALTLIVALSLTLFGVAEGQGRLSIFLLLLGVFTLDLLGKKSSILLKVFGLSFVAEF